MGHARDIVGTGREGKKTTINSRFARIQDILSAKQMFP